MSLCYQHSMYQSVFILFVFLLACSNCPECPPCPSSDKVEKKPVKDSGLKETDAGISPAALRDKPKVVASFELHGRAGFDKVNIFEKPDMDSKRVGYMRKGQRTRLGDPEYTSKSCPKGWFKLPKGGFVCQGRGMLVGKKPRFIRRAPPKPRVDELDPYRHGFVRRNWTPAYKRIPAAEEMWHPPTKEIEIENLEDGGIQPVETVPHDENEADGGVDYYKYTKKQFRSVNTLLSRGFWISVAARRFDEKTRKYYYETIKGDFVPGENVHLIKPPKFKGYEVLGDSPLPGAIVTDRHASFFTLRRERFRGIGPVQRRAVYRVAEAAGSPRSK